MFNQSFLELHMRFGNDPKTEPLRKKGQVLVNWVPFCHTNRVKALNNNSKIYRTLGILHSTVTNLLMYISDGYFTLHYST